MKDYTGDVRFNRLKRAENILEIIDNYFNDNPNESDDLILNLFYIIFYKYTSFYKTADPEAESVGGKNGR